MSSISNKSSPSAASTDPSLANITANANTGVGMASDPAQDPALLELLAVLGVEPPSTGKVAKGTTVNKFVPTQALTSQPPPLPQDRAPITPETQSLYQSMANDVTTAMTGARPLGAGPSHPDTLSPLRTMTEEEANTPEGQQAIVGAVAQTAQVAGMDLRSMGEGAMMAAFMVLQVRNQASGKEVTGVLRDLTADARKTSIDLQIDENKIAAQKVKEAAELQKKMGIFGPLIEAFMAIAAIMIEAFTFGAGTPLVATLIGAAIGFVAGGAVGGLQKGNGFDIGSAFSGMAIAASIARIAMKAVTMLITKMLTLVAQRSAVSAATTAAEQAAKLAAEKSSQKVITKLIENLTQFNKNLGNFSDKTSMAMIAANVTVQAAGTIAKAGMQYAYDMKTADAKEHQAKAKMAKVDSDQKQTTLETLGTSLNTMLETHQAAVNQVLSMLKTQFGAMQKSISQING